MEEAQEVNEDVQVELHTKRQRRVRNIHATVFEDNFGVQPVLGAADKEYQTSVVGFTQCLMYICEYLSSAYCSPPMEIGLSVVTFKLTGSQFLFS